MKIGTELFKWQSFQMSMYILTGIIKREKITMYELECQSCTHGYKCKILVEKVKGKDYFKFVTMLNEEEDDGQELWHKTNHKKEEMFYLEKDDALIAVYENHINEQKQELKKVEEKYLKDVEYRTKKIEEITRHLNNIKSYINSKL
jgi:septin family protein